MEVVRAMQTFTERVTYVTDFSIRVISIFQSQKVIKFDGPALLPTLPFTTSLWPIYQVYVLIFSMKFYPAFIYTELPLATYVFMYTEF